MDQNGNKTGGRQKGTPNRVNASIKVRIKDFILKNEEHMVNAFINAKPNEKLNFWYKMLNLVCAKQTSSKDDGEWRPGEGIDFNWMTGYERYKREMEEEEYQYQQEYTEKFRTEKELNIYRTQFFQAAEKMMKIISSNEFLKQVEEKCGKENFWDNMLNITSQTVVKALENNNIYPIQEIDLGRTIAKPKPQTPQPTLTTCTPEEPTSHAPADEPEECLVSKPSDELNEPTPPYESLPTSESRTSNEARTSDEAIPACEARISNEARLSSKSLPSNESRISSPSSISINSTTSNHPSPSAAPETPAYNINYQKYNQQKQDEKKIKQLLHIHNNHLYQKRKQ